MTYLDRFSVLAALVIAANGVLAAQDVTHAGMPMPAQPADGAGAATGALSHGTVRKVDIEAGRITIQHESIDSLGMPAMTMVYRAAHAGLLEEAKVGQAIDFRAERIDGAFVVTRLQAH